MTRLRLLPVTVALTVALLVGLLGARGTHALFTDPAQVRSGAFTAGTVAPVTGLSCADVGLNAARLSWTAQPDREWVLTFTRADTGAVVDTRVATTNGFTVDTSTTRLLALGTYRVRVLTRAPGTSWVAASVQTRDVAALTSVVIRCG